jgi:uncharacterized lipoprotein YbaY
MNKPLVYGETVFDPVPTDLSGAKVYIRLEDTSLANGPSGVVSEQVLTDVPLQVTAKGSLPFTLYSEQPDPRIRYSVSVHVDMQGNGRISHGDYINTESYPVLTYGYPNRITLRVRRV